jgi:ABC-type transporter Mla subunit MlaD
MFITQVLILLGLGAVIWRQEIIMVSQQEEADALNKIGDQLNKAIAELTTALANLGTTSPEVDAATQRLQAAAQALDDFVPDAP